ncbi:MAG: TSCPD domain-containing protein, partial [Candidatus Omnitrophica bacterium]|nr:TSCPD domain-containing protein [Candidatus Omnitrophota bacterium]
KKELRLEPGTIGPRPRPEVVTGTTTKVSTGCGNLYVTINFDEQGKPFEVFTQMGKAGGCAASQLEAVGRLLSLALRSGIDIKSVIDQLHGIRCPSPSWEKGVRIFSCADAISRVVERRLGNVSSVSSDEIKTDIIQTNENTDVASAAAGESSGATQTGTITKTRHVNIVGVCPDCGGALRHEEGCLKCHACGFSKC